MKLLTPLEVGADDSKIVLTARSGRSALAHRFKKLGYEFNRNDVDVPYDWFLQVADSKKEVEDKDLTKLAKDYKERVLLQLSFMQF